MKKKRTIVLTCFAAAGLAVLMAFIGQNSSNNKSLYKPTAKAEFVSGEEGEEAQSWKGASQWMFDRMKNQVTGEVDLNEVVRIQELANHTLAASSTQRGGPNSSSTAAVQWTELGPDDVGGRTRAILFDNQDATHTHMFAGGVAGGLWESTDGALNWHRCAGFFNVPGVVGTVVTIAQEPDGDLYVGTGEGNFYGLYGSGTGGFTGNGIYKSTDQGATWTALVNTQPSTQNSVSAAWIGVNKIACDPVHPNHIYAGTNRGFKESTDDGVTWTTPAGVTSATATCTDVQVGSDGRCLAIISNKPYLASDGYNFINVGTAAHGWSLNPTRTTISVAPSDPRYVYAFMAGGVGTLLGVYLSKNGGNDWTLVAGSGNAQFDPFGGNGQGTYDNIVSVDPSNFRRAVFGGTALYEWTLIDTVNLAGQWNQIAVEFPASPLNPFYVHSDKHAIVWHPVTPGVFYVGCDGGIFRTINNGFSYAPCNSGYNVTQCYSVGIENTAGSKNQAMAGCQDNGTNFIDGLGNSPMSSIATGGGDGGWCDISYLNPLATFQTVYFGALSRSNNRGVSATDFYDARITALGNFGNQGFASFVTPARLWESTNDLLTGDSIIVANGQIIQNKDVTNGDSLNYRGTLTVPYPVTVPGATLVLDSIMFVAGQDTFLSDAAGVLSHDGTGSVNGTTGDYIVTFNTQPAANLILKAYLYVSYGAGTVFTVNSNIAGKTISHTTSSQLDPGDTLKIQDILQSHIAVGFAGNSGIWLTRRALDFSTTPLWIKIAGANSSPSSYSGECSSMCWSADGNYLFVGTASGLVFRLDNLGSVTDSANGDVDFTASSTSTIANPNCQVNCTMIGNFSGRTVTMLDVDPNNPDHVVVSLGNYSNTQYVYYTAIATTATIPTGTFADKTATLDNQGGVPCYTVTFDKYDPGRVLVGTEHGIFETMDITVPAPVWVPAMTGLDPVPVDMIRQQRWEPWQVPNAGCFYIGTHGRGMWRDDSSFQAPNGINNPSNPYSSSSNPNNHDLKVFPNPVVDNSQVMFNLPKQGDATVQIYDLTGKLVFTKEYQQLIAGTNSVEFETQEFVKGTYIITVLQGAKRIGSGRFVKMN